jgi:hypothetical protein
MNELLFWLWGPGILILAAGIAIYLGRNDGKGNRHHPAE